MVTRHSSGAKEHPHEKNTQETAPETKSLYPRRAPRLPVRNPGLKALPPALWPGCGEEKGLQELTEQPELRNWNHIQRIGKDLLSNTFRELSTQPDTEKTLNKGYKFSFLCTNQNVQISLPSESTTEGHLRKVSGFNLGNVSNFQSQCQLPPLQPPKSLPSLTQLPS